jgi:hypothetical protein
VLNPEEVTIASDAIREFRVALSNLFLYSAENNMVVQSLQRFLQALGRLLDTRKEVTMGLSEGRLVVEGMPLDEHLTGSTNMIRDLFKTHELHSLTLKQGLTTEELMSFGAMLKPKSLAAGTLLAEALKGAGVSHVVANQQVFVAMDEDSAASLAMGKNSDDGEFSAAMEALQYFLQVFSRVKPDESKKEVARLVGEQIGEWIPTPGSGPGVVMNSPGIHGGTVAGGQASLGQVLAAVNGLKKLVESVQLPSGLSEVTQDLDQAMARLMNAAAQVVETGNSEAFGLDKKDDQEALFETDPIITSLEKGDLTPILDTLREGEVARVIQKLQEEPRLDLVKPLWEGIWRAVQSPEADIQTLGLRDLNRWKWENIPRPQQIDGLTHLKDYLIECKNPVPFQLALLLTYGWMSEEWKKPDWFVFNGVLRSLVFLEGIPKEAFPDQKNKTRLMLQGLIYSETYEELLRRSIRKDSDSLGAMETWSALGSKAANFLIEKILSGTSEESVVNTVYGILERLEFAGRDVLLNYLGAGKKPARFDAYLRLFDRLIMNRGVAERLRKMWDEMTTAEGDVILTAAAKWRRREFRDVALNRIATSGYEEALQALRLFPAFSQEGDSRDLIQTVENRDFKGKNEKDAFYIELCDSLGRLMESVSITVLEDWVQPKGFLDKLSEKSDSVKRAALQALGEYHSQQVRTFLEHYAEHGDKDLRLIAASALRSMAERLTEN